MIRSVASIVLAGAFLLLIAGTARSSEETLREEEFFEKKVRPLLVKRCYSCHSAGSSRLRANLFLDSRPGWEQGGDSGPAIVPGSPDQSLVIQAVRYTRESLSMPPTGKLPPDEIAILELWVARGAHDPREESTIQKSEETHDLDEARRTWPYHPPRSTDPPDVKDSDWPRDPLDAHVLARLEKAGLSPAADAGAATMARRLHHDLTGLPPSPAEVASFVADWDRSPAAAIRDRAERLLESPRFGEHWGRKWLDLARYADTNGSDFNATFFHAWKYRDYVIRAFNEDRPYDRFVREQVAGDLLPAESDEARAEGIIATGFLMLGAKMLSERDKEKLELDVVDEQLDTLGKAFLGMSLGCARCHDHKFDPISTEDYHALAGIFTSTETLRGEIQKYVSDWVRRELPIPGEHRAALEAHEKEKKRLTSRIQQLEKEIARAQEKIEKPLPGRYAGIVIDDRQAKLTGKWKTSTYNPRFVGVGYLHDDRQDKGKKSARFTPELPRDGEYEVRIAYSGGGGRDRRVPVTVKHAGGESRVLLDQVQMPEHHGLFQAVGRFQFSAGKTSHVTIGTGGTKDYVIVDAVQFIPAEELRAPASEVVLDEKEGEFEDPARQRASQLYREKTHLDRELAQLVESPPPPIPLALAVAEASDPGDCRIRIRGEAHNRGRRVPRGFPRVLCPDDESARPRELDGSGRLELASWLTRPDHPLTSRVMVNRVWAHLIGEGLVRTVDNFGVRGEAPTHPALLDRLAVDFVESGWSIKTLVRRVVQSRVYRMSTRPDPVGLELDPDNRLLWRMNRRPLMAEAIRDSLLLVSGQLDLTPGREPVKTFKKLAVNNNSGTWSGTIDERFLLKRSVYQPVVRGALPEILSVFDFADPDFSTGRRPVTTVPTQALFLLNSPLVRDGARRLAAEIREEGGGLDEVFLRVLGRRPTDIERERFTDYLAGEAQRGQLAEGVPSADAHREAWTRVVHALLATTEFRMLD